MAKRSPKKQNDRKRKSSANNLCYGIHAVRSLLIHHGKKVEHVYFVQNKKSELNERLDEIKKLAQKNNVATSVLSGDDFMSSDLINVVSKDSAHQGVFAQTTEEVLNLVEIKSWLKAQADVEKSLVLVLDQVTDPHNLGACMRSADAAGVDLLVLPKDNSASITATARKVAAGAAENIPILYVNNIVRALEELKQQGFWAYGLSDQAEKSLYDNQWPDKTVVIMGAEGTGMRRLVSEECDELLSIPMHGVVESLNVSVATGVVLYDINRQLKR